MFTSEESYRELVNGSAQYFNSERPGGSKRPSKRPGSQSAKINTLAAARVDPEVSHAAGESSAEASSRDGDSNVRRQHQQGNTRSTASRFAESAQDRSLKHPPAASNGSGHVAHPRRGNRRGGSRGHSNTNVEHMCLSTAAVPSTTATSTTAAPSTKYSHIIKDRSSSTVAGGGGGETAGPRNLVNIGRLRNPDSVTVDDANDGNDERMLPTTVESLHRSETASWRWSATGLLPPQGRCESPGPEDGSSRLTRANMKQVEEEALDIYGVMTAQDRSRGSVDDPRVREFGFVHFFVVGRAGGEGRGGSFALASCVRVLPASSHENKCSEGYVGPVLKYTPAQLFGRALGEEIPRHDEHLATRTSMCDISHHVQYPCYHECSCPVVHRRSSSSSTVVQFGPR